MIESRVRVRGRAVAVALAIVAPLLLPACGGGGGGGGAPSPVLTVSVSGPIGGVITSSPAGIACGSTCQYAFSQDAVVTLSVAVNDGNASFTGWSGETCAGTGACVVTMDAAREVTAAFAWTTAGADPWKAQNADREPLDLTPYVAFSPGAGRFALVAGGSAAPLVVSTAEQGEYPGVVRAVSTFQSDVQKVSGVQPAVANAATAGTLPVLVGTLGHSPLIDGLVTAGKLDVTGLSGKWETWHTQIVSAPMAGVASALVIAGSDQRGTIFGVYDLSRQIGISPWYFWDDVPPAQHAELYVLPGLHTLGQPAVKYRGFFINDENPALGTWVQQFYGTGTFTRTFYEPIFETMLRLRANYLWPAVWGKAFDLDDAQNHATAKAYGIVMGTSHEAPMDRGIEEFKRRRTQYGGNGDWSFRTNAEAITRYWTAGIQRMVDSGYEDVITVGMRGEGDEALGDGAALPLMESIIGTERQVIASVTGQDPTTVPQVWTLYKEVQGYWDRGFRAPADVTINWCDDNWGNLRALPDLSDPARSGGYGVYYHFDYVGAARNYKWVDTNLLPNVWEQMNLAYTYGVDRLWVVNGGDVKGNERPIQFFLDLAWSPETWTLDSLGDWQLRFAEESFGAANAEAIAELMARYERLQSRRKPELLNKLYTYSAPTSQANPTGTTDSAFSLVNYRELERIVEEWQELRADTETLGGLLSDEQQATFYQLVSYPIIASENVYALRLAQFRNRLYATQGRASAADWAEVAQLRFRDPEREENPDDWSSDQDFSAIYDTIVGGKWDGFQSESKLGYGGSYANSDWQSPSPSQESIWPALSTVTLQSGPQMGVAVDGSTAWSTGATTLSLPALSRYSTAPAPYVEVFNRGTGSFSYTITGAPAWLTISNASGTINDALKEQRAEITVPSWGAVPAGTTSVSLVVAGNSQSVTVQLQVVNRTAPVVGTFVEAGGHVAVQADHYTSAVTQGGVSWLRIPDVGRADPSVRSAGMTPAPSTTARIASPGGATPRLEYDVHLYTTGDVRVWAFLSPRNNVLPSRYTTGEGLKYGISIDDGPVQVINVTTQTGANDLTMNTGWQRNVADNVARTYSTHTVGSAGKHTVRFWMVDPTVILQKLVLDTGGLRDSQLGPPESLFYDP